jgi:hypothetical protein
MNHFGHDRNYYLLGHDLRPVMAQNFYWVVTEMGHEPRYYYEKFSL